MISLERDWCAQRRAGICKSTPRFWGGSFGYRTNSLPISPLDAKECFIAKVAALESSSATLISNISLGMAAAFNFLYGFGWTSNPIVPDLFPPLSAAQSHILDHIYIAAKQF